MRRMRWVSVPIEALKFQKIVHVDGMEEGSDYLTIRCDSGRVFRMFHEQDCCEVVQIVDIDGEEADLIGGYVINAEAVVGETPADDEDRHYDESYTWTFYKIDTNKGGVTLRWLGESNGYYSEEVSFEEHVEVS